MILSLMLIFILFYPIVMKFTDYLDDKMNIEYREAEREKVLRQRFVFYISIIVIFILFNILEIIK